MAFISCSVADWMAVVQTINNMSKNYQVFQGLGLWP